MPTLPAVLAKTGALPAMIHYDHRLDATNYRETTIISVPKRKPPTTAAVPVNPVTKNGRGWHDQYD